MDAYAAKSYLWWVIICGLQDVLPRKDLDIDIIDEGKTPVESIVMDLRTSWTFSSKSLRLGPAVAYSSVVKWFTVAR